MREAQKTDHQLQLIEAIKANDPIALKQFYVHNYYKIEAMVLKNSGSKEHAKDLYQDSFIAVWKNLKTEAFVPKNESALQGYLYQIAKHKWIDTLRSKSFKNTYGLSEDMQAMLKQNPKEELEEDPTEKKLNITMEAFKSLGQPCKSLLTSFYFSKKSLRAIASELNIGEASVRNKKYRCMEKLRSIALSSKS
ncbi:RNA polymerase sigma factor [Psychroserpens sp. XS_ASV72]|uniref:RNA polymerase sigma factor n=1 Tax=Psychroserpens sp. XS_ASV72 TaxID=3241293 RepID=UPI003512551F